MIRKTKHQKATRVAREKVSALRRQSARTKIRMNILHNDVYVESLIRELGELIENAQRQVAVTANAALTTLYWQVGRRVRTDVLEGRRAEYGGKLLATLTTTSFERSSSGRFGASFWKATPRDLLPSSPQHCKASGLAFVAHLQHFAPECDTCPRLPALSCRI